MRISYVFPKGRVFERIVTVFDVSDLYRLSHQVFVSIEWSISRIYVNTHDTPKYFSLRTPIRVLIRYEMNTH